MSPAGGPPEGPAATMPVLADVLAGLGAEFGAAAAPGGAATHSGRCQQGRDSKHICADSRFSLRSSLLAMAVKRGAAGAHANKLLGLMGVTPNGTDPAIFYECNGWKIRPDFSMN
jgi:hypothetical protein